jgi:hypothetical protein
MKKYSKRDNPPPQLVCTITGKLMRDPWTDAQGNKYDGPTIHAWIDRYGVNPVTGDIMTRNDVSPSPTLRALVDNYRPAARIYHDTDSPKKKIMKLMKFSVKAVRGVTGVKEVSSAADNTPDFDAIVRFRAQQTCSQRIENVDVTNEKSETVPDDQEEDEIIQRAPSETNGGITDSDFGASDRPSVDGRPRSDSVGSKKKKKKSRSHEIDSQSDVSFISDAIPHKLGKSEGSQFSANDRVAPTDQQHKETSIHGHQENRHIGFGTIEEGNDEEGEDDAEENSEWVSPQGTVCECGIWNPTKTLLEILVRDRTIRPALGEFGFCIDCLVSIALLWCLTDSVVGVLGLRLEGFMNWMNSDGSVFVRLVYAGYNMLASTALLVALGYYLPSVVFNTIQVDASKQNRYLMFTTYVKGMLPILGEGFFRVVPVLWLAVIIAILYGGLYPTASLIHAEYYTTCKSSWWTNTVFASNIYVLGTASAINETLSYSSYFDVSSSSMDLEYAYIGSCFTSLWLISCGVQLCVLALPLAYLYLEYPTAAINGTFLLILGAVSCRMYLASKLTSATSYAGLVYYSPWGRADAFFFGVRLFMKAHLKFVSPSDNNRPYANRDIGLVQLLLWTCWGIVPKEISHREFRTRRRRFEPGSRNDAGAASETSSLLGPKKKTGKKKKKVNKSPRPFDTLDDRHSLRSERMEEGTAGSVLDDDLDDSRSIFSQLTADSYKFPSTISYMVRAYEETDAGDDFTDIDRSVYSYETTPDATPVPVYWTSCLRFVQASFSVSLLLICVYWIVYSFTIQSTGGTTKPDWFVFSEWQYRNINLFVAAFGAYIMGTLATTGSVVPLSYVMGSDVWHPLSSLAFCFYVSQTFTTNWMCSLLYSSEGFQWNANGATNSEERGAFVVVYIKILVVNFVFALLLSVFVEKPIVGAVARYVTCSSTAERM